MGTNMLPLDQLVYLACTTHKWHFLTKKKRYWWNILQFSHYSQSL